MRILVRDSRLYAGQTDRIDELRTQIVKNTKLLNSVDGRLRKNLSAASSRRAYDKIIAGITQYNELAGEVLDLSFAGNTPEFNAAIDKASGLGQKVQARILTYLDDSVRQGQASSDLALRSALGAQRALQIGIVIAIVLAGGLATLLIRNISAILSRMFSETERLTAAALDGNLEARGEIGRVSVEFRPILLGMNQTLDAFLEPVDEAARVLGALANRISQPA